MAAVDEPLAPGRLSIASEAWMLLFELFKTQQRTRFDALAAEFGLTHTQAHALYLLGRPRPMGELAQLLYCDASNVTGIVDRLERRGLIERRPSAGDRRVRLLVLTEEGAELRERAVARFSEAPPEIAKLTSDDQRALRDILARALGPS